MAIATIPSISRTGGTFSLEDQQLPRYQVYKKGTKKAMTPNVDADYGPFYSIDEAIEYFQSSGIQVCNGKTFLVLDADTNGMTEYWLNTWGASFSAEDVEIKNPGRAKDSDIDAIIAAINGTTDSSDSSESTESSDSSDSSDSSVV